MSENRKCGNCGGDMDFWGEEQIQLGQTGFFLGTLSNVLSGSLDVEVWTCPECGKLDFYRQGSSELGDGGRMAQAVCPDCGRTHDLDDPKCPFCGARNPNI